MLVSSSALAVGGAWGVQKNAYSLLSSSWIHGWKMDIFRGVVLLAPSSWMMVAGGSIGEEEVLASWDCVYGMWRAGSFVSHCCAALLC